MNPLSMSESVTTTKAKAIILMRPDVKKRLEQLAKTRNRSMSNLVETLVIEELKRAEESGELPE